MFKKILEGIVLFFSIGIAGWLITKLSFYLGFIPMSEIRAMIFISVCMIICLGGLMIALKLTNKKRSLE